VDPFAGYEDDLAAICARWRVRDLAVFGSAARGEMRADSDIDVLVSFDPRAEWDLIDVLHMQDELEVAFGRKIDLVEREAIEESDNWIIRRENLSSARPLYART
jgi:uncharacterized protein